MEPRDLGRLKTPFVNDLSYKNREAMLFWLQVRS